jgi:hypothetical protein
MYKNMKRQQHEFYFPYNKINQFSAQHTWPSSTKGMDNPELEALSNWHRLYRGSLGSRPAGHTVG